MNYTRYHVAICVISGDSILPEHAVCLAALCATSKVPLSIIHQRSSDIAMNRNNAVLRVLEQNAAGNNITHILFIDTDIIFPIDILERLLAHKKEFVCATYPKRTGEPGALGYRFPLSQTQNEGDLTTFALAPVGCSLISIKLFELLEMPYFSFKTICKNDLVNYKYKINKPRRYEPVLSDILRAGVPDFITFSEDYYFTARIRDWCSLWVDKKLSTEIVHAGLGKFRLESI